jgi:hypothetical protein
MSDENDDGVFISDEEIDLNLTQSVRRKLVMDLTKDEKIGDDIEKANLLLKTLEGMDKQVGTKAKLRIAKKSTDKTNNMAAVVAALLNGDMTLPMPTNLPKVDTAKPLDYVVDNYVPGERDLGRVAISMDELKG